VKGKSLTHMAFVSMAQFYGVAIVICLVVWAATGADYFWPGWVILGVVVKMGVTARFLYGRS
jgi:hypothetical protein